MKAFSYFKPQTLKEASETLLRYGEEAVILNGGSDLVVRMKENLAAPKAVIDIKGIESLHEIKYDQHTGLRVGACVTLNRMAHDENVVTHYPILADAAEMVGSGQIRNIATMAGNNCNASPLADTATPLLALDAWVIIYSVKGKRVASIHDFFKGVRKTCLQPGEIVTALCIPSFENMKGVFKKASRRRHVDLATVCTSVVKVHDEIRIALGAVAPTPIRARRAEYLARGKRLSDDVIEEIARLAATTEATPIDDVRGTKDYRVHMVEVLVRRSLQELREEVKEG
ncbi:molybdopterin dehydrogenase, FAD-binding [Alkaliphilus metalliredigens QYMF]|uniref:Molybdopterin dehydrogenase, FAD-binding n=1 Tax=Alkaliphilus metalliredigens (strain QYMF) TaxID=293826 RepID=A6TL38_ALKMQ|nr:xanthine dehydrogenase family protein subunit M [Alkaliphilus metalliredigens]ABR46906.1 molybdopterin dehydrogenase, FAD-binding [Alkaliphilus metalliredigens QYMF]